jgi:hypothetical protein
MPMINRVSGRWLFLLLAVVLVRFASSFPAQVEEFYASGLFPHISRLQRQAFGWLPFSFGDLLYLALGLLLARQLYRLIWIRPGKGRVGVFKNLLQLFITIYLVFNLLWGMNYNRLTPARQMGLAVPDSVSTPELAEVTALLLDRTNRLRPTSMIAYREARTQAITLFRDPETGPVTPASMKPSLFGILGNYMGYSGYYNPFSGEAQVNTHTPGFLIPFVACHEIAHQAGFAKENEANFVGFLAARRSGDSSMLYSTYFNMFLYANGQLGRLDPVRARSNLMALRPGPRADVTAYKAHIQAYDTPVGTLVDALYDRFLRLNEQPAGSATYNKVVLWLVAYYRKYGTV